MQIQIQILTGRVINLYISPDDTIEEVSNKIHIKEGINPDQQILFFNGKKLDMGDTLITMDEYHITKQSTLFLTIRNLGG